MSRSASQRVRSARFVPVVAVTAAALALAARRWRP
jgi:hypothetical protein